MTEENAEQKYVTLENYQKGVTAAFSQGKILGILTALTDLHKDDLEIKQQLIALRTALGDTGGEQ